MRFTHRTLNKLGIMLHLDDKQLLQSPATILSKYSWKDLVAIHGVGESIVYEVVKRLKMVGIYMKREDQ